MNTLQRKATDAGVYSREVGSWEDGCGAVGRRASWLDSQRSVERRVVKGERAPE